MLSLAVLGLGVLVAMDAERAPLPLRARQAGVLLLAAVTFIVVTGTLSTAAGKFPGSNGDSRVHRLGSFQPAVALHVKAVAVFGVCFLLLAVWAWLNRARYGWVLRGCAGLLALLVLQMAIGETQYRLYDRIPWWVVLLHVTAAAALFGWTVGLVARLWRPAH
jgi:hypothetical protein